MTVNSYLTSRASNAILTDDEKASINTSVSALAYRLNNYFTLTNNGLSGHFKFGSHTRGTILPRRMDSKSDVDYMIVFEKGGFKPQTYLDRLRTFVDKKYATSEIYQSSPSVVLELNHIKFDLVPALPAWSGTYQIPDGTSGWQDTNPNDFNSLLNQINYNNSYMIKPTVRLMKYWNSQAGYIFDSFLLEKFIASLPFFLCFNQRDYLFNVFQALYSNYDTQWRNDRINRAKNIISKVKEYESNGMPFSAEIEIKKLIPE